MKRYQISLFCVFAAAPLLFADPPPGSFTLTFEEQFNTSVIDGDTWKVGPADAFIEGLGGNNVENYEVASGALSLKATTDPVDFSYATYAYSGAELTTFLRFKQKYGYFETRAKWSSVSGVWPAFWLMPERDEYGTKEWKNNVFIKFDLSSSGIGSVSTATLRLCAKLVGNSSSQPNNLQLFRVHDDSWTEGSITWNNQPAWDPLYIEQKFGYDAPTGTYVDFDVTEFVTAEVSGDDIVSFALADEFRKGRGQWFYSKEATTVAYRPQLIINGVAYYPSDDSYTKWGTSADTNYGSVDELSARSMYSDRTDSTYHETLEDNGVVIEDYGQGMEIDIFEGYGVQGSYQLSHATHWDGYGGSHKLLGWGPVPVDDSSEYHTYGVYWEEGLLEFYVDGVKTGVREDDRVMDVPAYILLSMQVGGSYAGNTPIPEMNNQAVDFDYVKVWSGTKSSAPASSTSIDGSGNVAFGDDYTSYSGNVIPNVAIADDGGDMSVCKNGWIKFPLSYTVTSDTWLQFTVEAVEGGEILGIGLDENDNNNDTMRVFQVAGTQTWANAYQDTNDYVLNGGPSTYVVNIGNVYTGNMNYLVIVSDDDAGDGVYAQFRDVKITEGEPMTGIDITPLNNGVAAHDQRSGAGYLMYSEADVDTRFGAYTGNAAHVIAVFYSSGAWYADTNFGQVSFTPVASDVLLADVDFTNDTVSSLEGVNSTENGISKGYASGDLAYIADWWNGASNDGEFGLTGSTFTPW
ncbi:DUF7594 domain-containing protein [Cerasicoccus frondis]|uniref:CBM96 family carbohydrate-binding protein n=1 Tax=Cerasicoccus frondis TaxID=490090 RepID=UPI002852D55F|nr:DNRLRE domain-containing protein [Cerasicoccus frondis]